MPQQNSQADRINRQAFFKYDAGAAGRYKLDIQALQQCSSRIVIGSGCAVKLAALLGIDMVEFPGNHAGGETILANWGWHH
jgi:hypothetical protein